MYGGGETWECGLEDPDTFLKTLSWKDAKAHINGLNNSSKFDSDKLANSWAQRLFKEFGHVPKKSPEVFGDALMTYMGESAFYNMVAYFSDKDE